MREFSCQHTPQQIRVTERKNRHILDVTCAMLHEKHTPNFYWAEAASTTVYLMNRCTSNVVHEVVTPYELLVGRKSILSHLKVFRSIANIRIPNGNREKPDVKSEECTLIGCLSAKKASTLRPTRLAEVATSLSTNRHLGISPMRLHPTQSRKS